MLGKMQWVTVGLAVVVAIGGGMWITNTQQPSNQFPPRFQVQVSGRLGVDNFKKRRTAVIWSSPVNGSSSAI